MRRIFALALMATLIMAGTVSAGTKTYNGTGNFESQNLTMTLGNGNTVYSAQSQGIATISTDPPTLLNAKCMGLGLITGENAFGAKVYCTFSHNDNDSFDLLADSGPKGGTAKIIGGSGKWDGATGSVQFIRTSTRENGGSFSYEMTITTP